ncbi:MAG: hypothetical protein EAZ99_17820 [Alphaproteobacteria bacterium]|nr:MAG: hypothetical protein EAZ99_17820 [Alphaproteobacteria bacterium]
MGDPLAAIAAYETVVSRFGDAPEAALREEVARALVGKGFTHRQLGDPLAAIAAYETVINRFGDAPEAALRAQVAQALVNKGFAHGQMGDPLAEIAAYETLITWFGDAPEAALREQVARALVNKGITHREMGDPLAAIAANETVINRFGDAPEVALREQVAMALVNKGFAHRQMGDPLAGIAAYETVINWFGDAVEPELTESVSHARNNLASLLTDFEIQSGRAEELLTEAAKRGHQLADSNRAYLALSQGHLDKAIALRPAFSDLPPPALHLFDAAVAFAQMNFGTATDHLAEALQHDLQTPVGNFTYDLDRVLRLAERQGFGEALIAWFERTGFADRLAPIFVAFVAYVRGEQVLKDKNPEVREPATVLYRRLSAPRRFREQQQPPPPSPRRRGRPRRTG